MSMRIANRNDINELKELWMDSFIGEEQRFCNKFFETRTSPENIPLIAKDEIIAALHLQPRTFKLGIKRVKGCNLVGAATRKECRKLGYMERLLTYSLSVMKDRGEVLCSLKPFLSTFYYKYGWIIINNKYSYKGNKDGAGIEHISITTNVSKVDYNLIDKLNTIYEEYSSHFCLLRSPEDWEFRLWDVKNHNGLIFTNDFGYALVTSEKEDTCKVIEIIYKDEGVYNLLLSEIRKYFSNIDFVSFDNITNCSMIRIVDLCKLSGMEKDSYMDITEGVYEVLDEFAPWNQGVYEISIRDNIINIERTDKEPTITCNINKLTSMIFNNENTMVYEEY